MLARANIISAKIVKEPHFRSGALSNPRLTVIVDDHLKIIYDTADSGLISERELSQCDFYFKRSHDPKYLAQFHDSHKVFPLGFNYSVYALEPNEHARKYFPDCVINDKRFFRKRSYLKLLSECDIGVATIGLQRSNGWKIAEYIAKSKAIITEPLQFKVTGEFAEGSNYLSFKTAEECVESITSLIQDRSKCYEHYEKQS